MNAGTSAVASAADREIVTVRVLDAPRELVYLAWTEPRRVAQWWGPSGFTNTVHEMDVRPGGVWRFEMHGPDGVDYPNKIVYDEVVEPERLAYTHGSGEEDDLAAFQVAVSFAERGGETELTMRMRFASASDRDKAVEDFGAIEGANSTMDCLADHLAKAV